MCTSSLCSDLLYIVALQYFFCVAFKLEAPCLQNRLIAVYFTLYHRLCFHAFCICFSFFINSFSICLLQGKQTSESTYALRPLPYNRTSSASPTSDAPNPITSAPWPFRHSPPAHSSSVPNGSGGYYRPMIHPQSEPQRQMSDMWFSRRIYTSEEENSAG